MAEKLSLPFSPDGTGGGFPALLQIDRGQLAATSGRSAVLELLMDQGRSGRPAPRPHKPGAATDSMT
ncbi:hypothetical protein Micbo1qcDRAFT_55579 [Microdochium bolleyi]|uniref:Uncharacterized protein n=1 Tax=Microdochium bolleyi TaxID=196109 RepID=A0A136J8M5_9PEZI|nr:hypothetical protein Micbo1qcDRAFT_55579 [Microdochium bolleyi]